MVKRVRSNAERKAIFAKLNAYKQRPMPAKQRWRGAKYVSGGVGRSKWKRKANLGAVRVTDYNTERVYDSKGRLLGYRRVRTVRRRS